MVLPVGHGFIVSRLIVVIFRMQFDRHHARSSIQAVKTVSALIAEGVSNKEPAAPAGEDLLLLRSRPDKVRLPCTAQESSVDTAGSL